VQKHFSQTPEQNDWQEFKPLFGGGKIKICDTLRAVTPFGGLSVLIEFFGRIGLAGTSIALVPLTKSTALATILLCLSYSGLLFAAAIWCLPADIAPMNMTSLLGE
jgi:hypothetical protein